MHAPTDRDRTYYHSIEALLAALQRREVSTFPHGGTVRLHPAMLPDGGLAARTALRQRLTAFGLRLLVTTKAEPHGLELRLYVTLSEEAR